MSREALKWSNVVRDELPEAAQELYDALWDAMDGFEEFFRSNAPKGKRPVFSYRHGNNGLNVGVALANGHVASNSKIDWLPASK